MPEARPGPGRPVGSDGPARRTQVRIPESVLSDLDAEAERRGLSRSRALVDAVKRWLREPEPAR